MADNSDDHLEHVVDIVAAYVSKNPVQTGDVPNLIDIVHRSLKELGADANTASVEPLVPAVPIKRSVREDHIVCLEDGKKFKSLKRHLNTHHGLSPAEYREKWGLSSDYPMVAPAYAKARSELAKKSGLGRKPKAARGKRGRRD